MDSAIINAHFDSLDEAGCSLTPTLQSLLHRLRWASYVPASHHPYVIFSLMVVLLGTTQRCLIEHLMPEHLMPEHLMPEQHQVFN